jgi:DNA-binding SARP family transcriptional activator
MAISGHPRAPAASAQTIRIGGRRSAAPLLASAAGPGREGRTGFGGGNEMTAIMEACPAVTVEQVIDVRILGPAEVYRDDGTVVDAREWRTGKTLDLLRMLALAPGRPLPADMLLAALWPDSPLHRAQSSLRTATFRIRQVLGRDCLERNPGGLQLNDVQVDFRALARQTRALLRAGDTSAAVMTAQRADAWYRGDLRAHDDTADWVVTERRVLDSTYQGLLGDAAEAAAALGLAREAVEFADRVLRRNPFSERASRVVMRGYAELGETSSALREFERCRRLLATELGVDPSPQTREVYLGVVRGWEPVTVR